MRYLSFFIVFMFFINLYSTTYKVNQNNSMDFSNIQEAINNSSNGDSILVYPGTYYETIDYLGKSLHIGSLFILTQDTTFISTTILDGNYEDAVVTMINCQDAGIYGFTITHGIGRIRHIEFPEEGRDGGGLYIWDSNVIVSNNLIMRNYASDSGGILFYSSSGFLTGNTITQNSGIYTAGGICLGPDNEETSNIVFDPLNKNSIYGNTCSSVNDILCVLPASINIPLKKASVSDLTRHYVDTYNLNQVSVSYECVDIIEVEADLYVSPLGNDNNSGLTTDQALRTISRANALIRPDSLNIHTIYVQDGIYSDQYGELFPIHLKPFIRIIGQSKENTIIDCEHKNIAFIGGYTMHYEKMPGNISLENLKILNTYGQPIFQTGTFIDIGTIDKASLKNIIGNNSIEQPYCYATITYNGPNIAKMENIYLKNAYVTTQGLYFASGFNIGDSLKIVNVKAEDFGAGLCLTYGPYPHPNKYVEICNFSLSGSQTWHSWPNVYIGPGLTIGGNIPPETNQYSLKVANSTFVNNSGGDGIIVARYVINMEFYNCLFYNNNPGLIIMDGRHYHGSALFDHCFLQNGIQDLWVLGQWDLTHNDILQGNPRLNSQGDNPLALSAQSPCIDAGTMNIPNYSFPLTDLDGNPRVYGNSIDIGAYELQSTPVSDHPIPELVNSLEVYPNPLQLSSGKRNQRCNIKLNIEKEERFILDLYNIKGQKVKHIMDGAGSSGSFSATWNGTDDNGNSVGSGVYFLKLYTQSSNLIKKITIVK